jgi:hypothetical protein
MLLRRKIFPSASAEHFASQGKPYALLRASIQRGAPGQAWDAKSERASQIRTHSGGQA